MQRPVFLDGRRGQNGSNKNCAVHIDSDDGKRRIYLTNDFEKYPNLFLSDDVFVQNLLITDPGFGRRFHYIEQP